MVRKSRGAAIITSWPNLPSQAAVCAKVLTTPLVCGNQASVTIMILMRGDILNEDRDNGVKAADKKQPPTQRLVMCS
jgi:phosphohistidine swiveling domain-containing protein